MIRVFLSACAALVLAACGQPSEPVEEAPAPPQTLFEEVQAMSGENQLVFAYQKLVEYQQAHPESQPVCQAVRSTESRGVIPENIEPESIYAQYAGAAVFSIQCGELISATRFDPNEHWLVAFTPGANEVSVANCAGTRSRDLCPRELPTVPVSAEQTAPAP